MADQSSQIDWQPRLGEQFVYAGKHYDLAKAKELIKASPRPVEMRPLGQFKSMYYEAVKIDWDKAERTDPTIPLIVATEEGKPILIDGWHRYAKCLRARQTEVPTVVLTEDETKVIRR
jgi:hypothetical protein